MVLDTELLSRIQFALTIGFHILFPTLNIGLAVFLCFMEGAWLKTGRPEFYKICRFWTKIFALTFGMGVVSGVVMSYELGTNFGRFTEVVGGVLGPLFSYEVLSAFFLEAGFLGVMLFGWHRVGPKLHYAATLLVAIGTLISAFWIMSANSWMQTPSGYQLASDGRFIVTDWWQVIFNPSVIPRFIHMLIASFVSCNFFLAGISAWYLLKRKHLDIAKPVFSFTLAAALLIVPLQIWVGDELGLEVHNHQPIKTAAIEANWHTMQGAPLVLFALPDKETMTNRYAITIPYGASVINTHHLNGTLQGLSSVSKNDWPVIYPVFFGFRIMVGIGFAFLAVALFGLILRVRKHLYDNRLLQRICILLTPFGFIATVAGWFTAESGRQPWVVYGLLRTQDANSLVPASHVFISLALFIGVYGIVFSFYLYYLFKFIGKGPVDLDEMTPTIGYIPNPKKDQELHP
jgi:cytochrome d ubiquinol oxidase subunit I